MHTIKINFSIFHVGYFSSFFQLQKNADWIREEEESRLNTLIEYLLTNTRIHHIVLIIFMKYELSFYLN